MHSARRDAHARQAGETLVESIVTIGLMSVVVVGMLAAIWTTIRVSDVTHRNSRAGVEATSLAHVFLGLPHASASYSACETASQFVTDYIAASNTSPLPTFPTAKATASTAKLVATNGDVAVLTVQYLTNANPAIPTGDLVATATFGSTCTTDLGAQQLTVTVTSASGLATVTQSVSVVRRNDVCSTNPYATLRPGYLPGQRC